MLKEIIVFVFALGVCYANTAAVTATPSHGVLCGYMPSNIFSCLGNPTVVSSDISAKCGSSALPCDKMKCIFRKSGWLKDDKVDKKKMSDHFDSYAREQPAWSAAVNHLKAACLGDRDLPAQGVLINCPAYDVIHCALTSFIRNASPSQWRAGEECSKARQYAGACPVCPDDCFSAFVPNDSCHACLALPRSA